MNKKGSLKFKFYAAWSGIVRLLKLERNARIHTAATVLVVIAGLIARLHAWQWAAVVIVVGIVWSMELMNTALEILADKIHPQEHPLIGAAKDAAAGAVLVASITAVLVGVIVFASRLFEA
ncbi:MAG: diacylglycerol kinase family protein [Peptococcaceae bacterium]|jgi:diacylglycerol kinase|nr:diacylglycerol kinase family protein [Peptococcaceae bacterium]